MNNKSQRLLSTLMFPLIASGMGYDNVFSIDDCRRGSQRKRKPTLSAQDKQKLMSSFELHTFKINGVEIQAHSKKDAKKIYARKYKK